MTAPLSARLRQGKRVLLVVEDDPDTSAMLSTYFTGHGYQVEVAARGDEALVAARQFLPDVLLLDIRLPDIDGFTVCQLLRAAPRTNHIPVIFLTEKASPSERVAGLEAGAQDYITKPFDLEELRLRIQNLVARSARENMIDPRSHLPTGPWVEEQLRHARAKPGWHVLECRIDSFQPFVDLNGFVAGDEVLKFAGRLMREVVNQLGTPDDFVGHPAHDTFLVLTAGDVPRLTERLAARFNEDVLAHYSFMDREQGHVTIRDRDGQMMSAPLMTLTIAER